MIIKNKLKMMIVDEIDFIVKMMDENPDLSKKLYYLSGVHALIHRIFNQDFDEDLIFLHLILHNTHGSFMSRLQAIEKGRDMTVLLLDKQIDALSDNLKELSKAIEKKENIDKILKRFTILSYSTTGNGYYLLQKGLLKI
jgi:hypothetical protein